MEISGLAKIAIALLIISLYVIEGKIVRKNTVNCKVLMRHLFLDTLRILILFG